MSNLKEGDRRRSARIIQNKINPSSGGGGRRKSNASGFRLKLDTRKTRLTFSKREEFYEDPVDPNFGHPWKVGARYFIKKGEKMFPVEMSFKKDLIDAYKNPAKYGFQDMKEISEGHWLSGFEPSTYYCLAGWVEDWYHLVLKTNPKSGKKFLSRDRCEGRGCPHCKDPNVPKVFGNRFWMDFSVNQWNNVIERVLDEVERNPKDGGYVCPSHLGCEECGTALEFYDSKAEKDVCLDLTNFCQNCGSDEIVVNAENHSATCEDCGVEWPLLAYESDVIRKYMNWEIKCQACGHKGLPRMYKEHSDGLKEWEDFTLFDTAITLAREPGTEERAGNIIVKGWEIAEPDPRLFDPMYQGWDKDASEEDKKKAEAAAEWNRKGIDLDWVHSDPDPEDVAESLGVPNLFAIAEGKAQNAYRPRNSRVKGE